jgi:hypothetical protein
MVSSNQRSIYEGIRKVIGSSNRGFITLDPERQPRAATQGPSGNPAHGSGDFRPRQSRPETSGPTGNRNRA